MAFQYFQATPQGTSGCTAVFQIKEWLKSVGWAVLESSDGTTYNASGDQITHSESGAGGLNNASAWFRMAPGTGGELPEFTIQRVVNSSDFRVKFARAAFNAGTPGATQTPATTIATDEIITNGAGTDAVPTGASLFAGTGGAFRLKGGADDASPYGFWFALLQNGVTTTVSFSNLILDPLQYQCPGDAQSYVFRSSSQSLQVGSMSSTAAAQYSWEPSATPNVPINAAVLNYRMGSNQAVPPSTSSTGVPTSTQGGFISLPVIYCRNSAAANPGHKGVSSLMRWSTPYTAQWQVFSVNGYRDRIAAGEVTLPWGGDVPEI